MTLDLTRRQSTVLAGLAANGATEFAPVQVQKLFFLLDEQLNPKLGGALFSFQAYNYGPFDPEVYRELEHLERLGLVRISPGDGGRRRYAVTAAGEKAGQDLLASLPDHASRYIMRASSWVRSLGFAELVGSIYKAFPHMRENSIFVD